MLSFLVVGMSGASLGVMIPYMEQDYRLSDVQVSAIFLMGPAGYCIAAYSTHTLHTWLGRRGISIIGSICLTCFALTGAARPSFHVFMLATALGSFGNGLIDGSFCAWAANMKNANTTSGMLHGSWSVGSALGPFLSASMISLEHTPWYSWYYVLAGSYAFSGCVLTYAFKDATGIKYRQAKQSEDRGDETSMTLSPLIYPIVWVYALYTLVYDGGETTVSNWLVSFMIRVRGSTPFFASVCSSAFWIGMVVGRLALGTVTDRLGTRLAVVIYLLISMMTMILFILIDVGQVSAVLMALLGLMLGPLFPSCVVQLVGSLPAELHVRSVAFVASFGQVGGAMLPYGLGAITDTFGLVTFQYMLLVQIACTLFFWSVSLTMLPSPDG
ncbi:MFS general substrate transporter [Sarocladium strictum]